MSELKTIEGLKVQNKTLSFKTKEQFEFIDMSDQLEKFVEESGIKDGIINIQSLHTTAVIIVNENEPLLIEDMKKNFATIAKKDIYYGHDDFDIRTVNMCDGECKNGSSHCLAAYMPTSVTLNLSGGKVQFGQWQRIFLLELDRSRPRKVQIQILGI